MRVDGGGCWDFQYARDLRAENTALPNARYNLQVSGASMTNIYGC